MKIARVLWSNAACALPWAAVALVLVVAACINQVIDLAALSYDTQSSIPASLIAESGVDLTSVSKHLLARIAWGIPAIGFSLVAMVTVMTALLVIVSCFRELSRHERFASGTTMTLAAVLLLAIVAFAGGEILSEPAVMTSLRVATMHRTTATYAVSVDTFFDKVSYVIFLLLLCAASATLVWPRGVVATAAALSQRLKQIRWLLYAGAAALVLRAIEMHMLYRWPGVWLSNEMADAVSHMALALSTAHGAFFSAILMALYLPAALVIRMRSKLLATQAVVGTDEAPEAWLAKEGLSASPYRELVNVFLTVAPLIAGGSIAKVMGALAG